MPFPFPTPENSGNFVQCDSSGGKVPPDGARPARTAGGTLSAGLVYSSTSGKPLRIDPIASRMNRMRSSCITSARLHQESVTKGGFRGRWAFLCLTYADIQGWNPRDLPELLGHIRKWLQRRGNQFGYVWVAELQQRGAMHYHIMIWLPNGLTLPKPDKQGWWRHGWTKIEWARNPVGYMAKYASKGDGSTKFPKGARIYGCGGLRSVQLQEARYWKRPSWLRHGTSIQQVVRRRQGGGWFDIETGEMFESPWRVFFEGGGVWICLKGVASPDGGALMTRRQGGEDASMVAC